MEFAAYKLKELCEGILKGINGPAFPFRIHPIVRQYGESFALDFDPTCDALGEVGPWSRGRLEAGGERQDDNPLTVLGASDQHSPTRRKSHLSIEEFRGSTPDPDSVLSAIFLLTHEGNLQRHLPVSGDLVRLVESKAYRFIP